MGVEHKRKRAEFFEDVGMSFVVDGEGVSPAQIAQLQQNVQELFRQIQDLGGAAEEYDDSWLRAQLKSLKGDIDRKDLPDIAKDVENWHHKCSTWANRPSASNGHFLYVQDTQYSYVGRNQIWGITHAFWQTGAPSGIGEQDGDRWYDTDDDIVYDRVNGAWVVAAGYHLSCVNWAARPAVQEGYFLYVQDKDNVYVGRSGSWRIFHCFWQDAAPSGIGEQDGDTWYDTDDHTYAFRKNGAWNSLSDFI